MALPDPVIEKHEGFFVVRDDRLPGGTKRRVLGAYLAGLDAKEFVYPSTPYGMGPVALAYACRDLGRRLTLFYPERDRKNFTAQMKEVQALGAKIVLVPHGFMTVLKKRSRDYAAQKNAHLLPLGLNIPEIQAALTQVAKKLPVSPREVWCAAGTGTLTRALQDAWPRARHHAVTICTEPTADLGKATLHKAKEPFAKAAKQIPPYPSVPQYDAKIWTHAKKHAKPGALIWNVAG